MFGQTSEYRDLCYPKSCPLPVLDVVVQTVLGGLGALNSVTSALPPHHGATSSRPADNRRGMRERGDASLARDVNEGGGECESRGDATVAMLECGHAGMDRPDCHRLQDCAGLQSTWLQL